MEKPMNRFFALLMLAGSALLLTGCPDTKLPTPTPMVPKPKAQETAHRLMPDKIAALHRPATGGPLE